VAAFDTAFHQTIPQKAYMYAIPRDLYEKFGIRRYGFHGTSHRFVARRAAALMKKTKNEANVITCHLGNGCSITAVKGGKSIDTSMGLTPLEGLVMGTRSGDIDPAIIFYLAERQGMSTRDINNLLNKKSGLLGVSGVSNDMRSVMEEASKGNEKAELAIEIFCYRIKKYIGAYTAALGHVDAIAFTGGIGENSTLIREKALDGLACLGIKLDTNRNCDASKAERLISSRDSKVNVFVIPTNEEVRIAYDTHEIAPNQ
jgi:acetate kinase